MTFLSVFQGPVFRGSILKALRAPAIAAFAAALLLGMSACVHRIDIQQGNFLDKEDIDRVSVGMTRVQVRSLLGTPMVADPFDVSRWDYVYYFKKGRLGKPTRRHFIVYFDGSDKVARIEREVDTSKKS
jgi:outer membrane protein assembly factor BamE